MTSTPRKILPGWVDVHCSGTKGGEWQVPCYMQDLIQLLSDDSVLSVYSASFVHVSCLVAECHGIPLENG